MLSKKCLKWEISSRELGQFDNFINLLI